MLNTVAEDWFPERGVDHGPQIGKWSGGGNLPGHHSGIRSTKLQSQAHEFLSQRSLALPQLEFHLVNSSHNRNNLSDT